MAADRGVFEMRSPREHILASVRRSLHRAGPLDESVGAALQARIDAGQAHIKPSLGGDLVRRFVEKVDAAAAQVERLVSTANLSRAVLEYLEREGLPKEIVVTSDEAMEKVRWSNELTVSRRAAVDADRTSVTTAFAGIAETGTVALISSQTNPTSLNFLPEHHIVVLHRSRIVAHIEDVWALLRQERSSMPRTVNLITGPSRTGDIELSMEFGAHGPRRLYVMLVGR